MYDQLIVDLETLGTKPGAVILSVALVEWNWKGEIGKKGVFKIPLAESVAKGFVIEPETVKWWNEQDKIVFAKALNASVPTNMSGTILSEMMNFFADVMGEKTGVWGNGSSFDLVLLKEYFDGFGYHTPWNPRIERDVRTIVSLLPEVKREWKFEGTKHDPVDDCLNQIGYLVETVKRFSPVAPGSPLAPGGGTQLNPKDLDSWMSTVKVIDQENNKQ
ncbi:3'-5' exonuclease [Lacihabitans soyangensis]|uniref:3'-5' exoribonuclease n=1 Tax=Lacihabitans soyangensis TaxID=869394 RepID=A0AAE3H405_9BACT|nr:3'-5' exonuclease [Lacihabitans soyangensis]MCP9764488.1 3'-5' exoribonuclease [Lacihabitans soyangensis]